MSLELAKFAAESKDFVMGLLMDFQIATLREPFKAKLALKGFYFEMNHFVSSQIFDSIIHFAAFAALM